jgi:hypothetical protein
VDGVETATETVNSAMVPQAGVLDIGRKAGSATAADYFDGVLDEVRVDTVGRSADYVKLCYESQRPSGNLFWGTRAGPNNLVALTATAGVNSIALTWNTPVSDSSNADSLGIWVKYSGYPDSANAPATTRVVRLAKTDSSYSYPATYPATYYFGLAVRNANGAWSPVTGTSSDTAVLAGLTSFTDTVYVDSAIGSSSNTCTQARNPATPMRTLLEASWCEWSTIRDTLVIRVMPGVYTDSSLDPNSKPQVVVSFDPNSRAILAGAGNLSDAGARPATFFGFNDLTLKNLDFRCSVNGNHGIYLFNNDPNVRIEGCRIYNGGPSTIHTTGIHWWGTGNNNIHVANTLIHQPSTSAILIGADNAFNLVNNVFVGNGTSNVKGVDMYNATAFSDMTITNNVFYNWDYGLYTASANIGTVSNNLFHKVTSGREVSGTSDANKILKDPLFANMTVGNPNAFKLLPGSPAIDAGTASFESDATSCAYRSHTDQFGNSRPQGSAPDIGLYEGTGHTTDAAGEFDTLTTSSTSTTVTVENSKWKILFDRANGGGINALYDKTTAPSTNLIASNTLLFDVKIDAYTASAQTAFSPSFLERPRSWSARAPGRWCASASTSPLPWMSTSPTRSTPPGTSTWNRNWPTCPLPPRRSERWTTP